MERREAPPADRRRLANPNPGSAARHGRSPVTRGCRFRARWPNNVGPGASRRSNAMPVVGHRTLLRLQTSRSTTTSIEQGDTEHRANKQQVKLTYLLAFAKEFRRQRVHARLRRAMAQSGEPLQACWYYGDTLPLPTALRKQRHRLGLRCAARLGAAPLRAHPATQAALDPGEKARRAERPAGGFGKAQRRKRRGIRFDADDAQFLGPFPPKPTRRRASAIALPEDPALPVSGSAKLRFAGPRSAARGRAGSRPASSSRRSVSEIRLRAMSTSSTLTRTMSPGFTTSRGSFTKVCDMRRDVHQAVLVHADVDERAERGDVGDDALEQHAGREVVQRLDAFGEVRGLEAGRGSRPGFSSSLRMSVTVGRPNVSSTNGSPSARAGPRRCRSASEVAASWREDAAHHRVGLGVHRRGVERVVAAGDAQEAGALLERLGAEPRHVLERPAGAERAVGVAVRHDAAASPSPMPETRASSGADAVLTSTPTRVHAVLDDRVRATGRA